MEFGGPFARSEEADVTEAMMDFLQLPRPKWREFFDAMSEVMRGKLVEVEVAGLDVGDQIETKWAPANGIAYEPNQDVLYVYTQPEDSVDHAIPHPREVSVELGSVGVNQVVVVDSDERKQFVRLRAPLELPAENATQVVAPRET